MALVASGAEDIGPLGLRWDVTAGSPAAVAIGRLNMRCVEGTFNVVRTVEIHSPGDWQLVVDFTTGALGRLGYHAQGNSSSLFAESDEVAVVVSKSAWGSEFSITVAAETDAEIDRWVTAFSKLLPDFPPPEPVVYPQNVVPVSFWMQDPTSGRAYARRRDITIHNWEPFQDAEFGIDDPGVRGNYPAKLQAELDTLMSKPEPDGGKLMLFHGPPGTGKTRGILTLISEWRSWCHASVVTDADKFFGDATYLNSIIFDAEGMSDWLLLVIEDGDEFLNVDSADSKGQSIARLLNMGDGIIGQGLNLLTLITTNVAVDKLNPAIIRPGRAMCNLEFGKFSPEEATAWTAERGRSIEFESEATLAEMYRAITMQAGE
jgi:hypothetical protein